MTTRGVFIVSLVALAATANASGAVELTQSNFDEMTKGKNSFVKFLAPCGEELCESFEIRGYPTIKYFLDGDSKGQDYQGGRDFDSLKTFVEENLEVKCDVRNPTECSEKEKSYIEKMKAKSKDDRVKQIIRLEGMVGESMKADLKTWLRQRLHILRSLDG